MEENNNKEYYRGLITGALCAIVVILLVLTGSKLKTIISQDKSIPDIDQLGSSSTEENETTATLDTIKDKMQNIYDQIDSLYLNDIDMNAMEDAVCKAMVDSLGDVYTVYYNEEELDSMLQSVNGSYCGIGVAVGQNVDDKKIYVTTVFSTSPAKKAGIQPGDQIIKVDDNEVGENTLDTVVSWVKGDEGTEVTVTVIRDEKEQSFTMKRSDIEIDTVYSKMLDNNVGYIEVAEFDEVTTSQFSKAVEDLKSQGMEKIIVDLRDNPGGRMDVVCDMVNTFLEKDKLILYTEDKAGNREEQSSTRDGELIGMPLVVLVNGNSASASEVFTGVIKDYKLGTVVGTQTFGKGIVQRLVPLNDSTALKVTYSKYFTPGGVNIHGTGITPDEIVELPNKAESPFNLKTDEKDTQLEKAIEVLK